MTIEEYTANLQKLIQQGTAKAVESIVLPAGNALLAKIKQRIQNDGKNSSGGSIGSYSTRPTYVTGNDFDKTSSFKPVGKNGTQKTKVSQLSNRKTKNIPITNEFRERKSMYLPQGYKQLRDIQGKQTAFMDLTYRGDLLLDYRSEAVENAVLLGFTRKDQSVKRKGIEAKKGKIFPATQAELNDYSKEVAEESALLTTKILSGAA